MLPENIIKSPVTFFLYHIDYQIFLLILKIFGDNLHFFEGFLMTFFEFRDYGIEWTLLSISKCYSLMFFYLWVKGSFSARRMNLF